MSEDFNMTMRKFLKQVGVTSQQAIEEAIRNAPGAGLGKKYEAKMVLTIEEIGLEHTVSGYINSPD